MGPPNWLRFAERPFPSANMVVIAGSWFGGLCERLDLEADPAAVEEYREALVAHWQRITERGGA